MFDFSSLVGRIPDVTRDSQDPHQSPRARNFSTDECSPDWWILLGS